MVFPVALRSLRNRLLVGLTPIRLGMVFMMIVLAGRLLLLAFDGSVVRCSPHVSFKRAMLVVLVRPMVNVLYLVDLFKEVFNVGIVHATLRPLFLVLFDYRLLTA